MDDVAGPVRVLVENADGESGRAQAELLRARGFDVDTCGGPRRLDDGTCRLVDQGGCPLVDAADVVLYDLDLDDERDAAVYDELRRTNPAVPIVLELPTSVARRHARRLRGATVFPPFDAERLVEVIGGAVEASPKAIP